VKRGVNFYYCTNIPTERADVGGGQRANFLVREFYVRIRRVTVFVRESYRSLLWISPRVLVKTLPLSGDPNIRSGGKVKACYKGSARDA